MLLAVVEVGSQVKAWSAVQTALLLLTAQVLA
jgi:hypothetical protein